jgi:hypothetical protein
MHKAFRAAVAGDGIRRSLASVEHLIYYPAADQKYLLTRGIFYSFLNKKFSAE